MIRVLLQGRTGNNLFQYAVGRALATRHQTQLILDGSWANKDQARHFLHLLRLPLNAGYVRKFTLTKRVLRRTLHFGPEKWHKGNVHHEPCGHAAGPLSEVSNLPDGTMLIGYYQSEDYFSSIQHELRKELSLEGISLCEPAKKTLDLIKHRKSASMHIRRGDYLSISSTQCVPDNYHQSAVKRLKKQHEELQFFVFSDDIDWCKKKFSGSEFHFSESHDRFNDPLSDLKLMASCNHHIITNSSYSWWGAWLNPSQNKTVVAPKMWMKNTPSSLVIPKTWEIV